MVLVVDETAGHCSYDCECEEFDRGVTLRECLLSCEDNPSCLAAQHHDQHNMECEHCPVECTEIRGGMQMENIHVSYL